MPTAAAPFGGEQIDAASRPTWVFFCDKRLEPGGLTAKLDRRAQALTPRALARRARHRADGGVDERDLEPSRDYVSAVLAIGVEQRAVSRWLNAISVWATPEQIADIEALPHVACTKPVAGRSRSRSRTHRSGVSAWAERHATKSSGSRYGVSDRQLEQIGVPDLHSCGLTGAGVIVGVQDTGFALDHKALRHIDVVAARDFINDDDIVANEDGDVNGQDAHGTAVLSLLAGRDPGEFSGAAPDVSVILAKTEDTSQEKPIEEDWYVEGLEWIESLGADLFTASLGYIDWYQGSDLDGETAVTSVAAGIAIENGLIMLTSAGNDGPGATTIGAPADVDGIIAVGAVDRDGMIADFSSRGPTADGRIKPDVSAMGEDTWVVDTDARDEYVQGNGTSYATPLVAGLVALLKQADDDLSPAATLTLLTTTASQADAPDNIQGWGVVSGTDAVGLYCSCQDADDDGFYDSACGGEDCDDQQPSVHPGSEEICDDGVDNDCDGADTQCLHPLSTNTTQPDSSSATSVQSTVVVGGCVQVRSRARGGSLGAMLALVALLLWCTVPVK